MDCYELIRFNSSNQLSGWSYCFSIALPTTLKSGSFLILYWL